MRDTCGDENLPLPQRQLLCMKKVKRDLARWKRAPETGSKNKVKKLRKLMKEIGIDEAPWTAEFEDRLKLFQVYEVMTR